MSLTYDDISTSDRRNSSHESGSSFSMRTDTTWRYSVFGPNRLGKGAMLFTGPDGIRDHRQSVVAQQRYVGEGTMSPEGSSEAAYLWRASSGAPHPRPKSRTVGEVGWGVPEHSDWLSSVNTGPQIKLGEFRQAAEDRHTHLYQNPWYLGQKKQNSVECIPTISEENESFTSLPAVPVGNESSPDQPMQSNPTSPNPTGAEEETAGENDSLT